MVDAGKTAAQVLEAARTTQKKSGPAIYFGFLPVLLFLALVISLWLFPPSVVVFEPHYLLPLFNSSLFLAALVIASIALRSYLISGVATILWLGCGVLTLGAGLLAAGWLIFPFGPNVNVTIFTVAVLLASICHAGGGLSTLEAKPGEADPGHRRRKAALGYLAALTAIALLVVLTLAGIMPPFFIPGKGPTIVRQYVVEWTLVLLIFASLVMMRRFLRKRTPFHYWYSLALAFVAISLLAFYLQPAVGSPIGWVGRSSYMLAAVYFLLAVNSAWREARTRGVGLGEARAELFGPGLHWQGIMATVRDAVVSYDDNGEILLWNKAAERIFGYPEAEVVGKGIDLILPDTLAREVSGRDGGISEIELWRQDGSRFNAEISISTQRSSLGMITTLVIRDVTDRQRVEEDLRESRAQLQTIFDNLSEGVVVSTLDGQFLTWNRAALEMHGYASLEECRRSLPEFTDTFELASLDGAEVPLAQWPLSRVLRGEQLRDIEVRVRRQDQAWERIYNYGGALVRDREGTPLLAIVSMTDITARKRTEREIQRLASFPQMNPQPVLEMDTDGHITYYNQAALEALGEMGQAEDLKNFLPDDLQEILATAKQTGEKHFQREVVVNDSVFLDNIYFAAQFNAVRLYAVDITGRQRAEAALRRLNEELEQRVEERTEELQETVAQLEEEITDRQRAEQQAASLGRLYRLLSRVYEVIVHAQDQEGLFRQACRIMMEEGDFLMCWIGRVDWEAGLVRAATQFDLMDDYPQNITISLADAPEGRGPTGVAVREGRWDVCLDIVGDPRMVPWRREALARGFRSSAAFPLFLGGRVEGVLSLYSGHKGFFNQEEVAVLNSLAQDLSFAMESMDREAKRRQAEEEIRRLNEALEQRVKERTTELELANRELEAFAYSVSHDLKAPLRAIQGFSRMLLGEHAAGLDEEGLRMFNVIISNTQTMARLIDDLLALSRLGRQQLRKSPVNLAVMARQVFEQLQVQEPDRDLRLVVHDLPPAWGDHALLNQVMMNLLGNATKYTRAKKTASIEVDGYTEGRESIYRVKDNGVGFDERYAHKLFGVFQRLHGSEYEGTGVGLAIVQRIIHRHGGRVWAEGKEGAGATFYFSLPKKED